MSQHKQQQGFLTFAKNTAEVNYLDLAYIQACNIKDTQKTNSYAIVVDRATEQHITEQHLKVFDYVITTDIQSAFSAEVKAFWLTPFKETIKLESDLLFTRSIDHWWDSFRLKDILLSTGCRNYLGEINNSRKYREVFDINHLPDVYNGLMYFRFSKVAAEFFRTALLLQENWTEVKSMIKQCNEELPSTDLLYALTALVVGEEKCTAPSLDFINFVHMKPAINGYAETQKMSDIFVTEFNQGMIRVNNINQYHPFHYYEKDFINNDMREYYGRRIGIF